ncbi:MAG: Triosephosphate isomerase [Hyphomicrobiales bacterium]|nr:Triosephosphate isomerase [Hyphomicrobiales bacterium]
MAFDIVPLIAGNWKMNGLRASLDEVTRLKDLLKTGAASYCSIAICPPATLLAAMSTQAAGSGIAVGGQDCHQAASGAHTGDISAAMLADAGARYVIVGHSERRADHGETDALVSAKASAAIEAGLIPIICVGESEAERKAGLAAKIVGGQLAASIPDAAADADFVVAYEPVWAIGTGLTPTSAEITAMHDNLRAQLAARFGKKGATIQLLYGGSLKPGNAREILAIENVNGGLVGGASLLANDFFAIISAA